MSRDRLDELRHSGSTVTLFSAYPPPSPASVRVTASKKTKSVFSGCDAVIVNLPSGNPAVDDTIPFLDQAERVQVMIARVESRTREIAKEHRRALSCISEETENEIWEYIQTLMDDNTKDLQVGRSMLSDLAREAGPLLTRGHSQLCHLQQTHLTQRLLQVSTDYQNVQKENKRNYEARMMRQLSIARPSATQEELRESMHSTHGVQCIFAQDVLKSTLSRRQHIASVEQRHSELLKLETSIAELADLHTDFELFLESQQTLIDGIEMNAENVDVALIEGNKEINKAIIIRKASRRKWVWVMVGIIVLLAIAAVIMLVQFRGSFRNLN